MIKNIQVNQNHKVAWYGSVNINNQMCVKTHQTSLLPTIMWHKFLTTKSPVDVSVTLMLLVTNPAENTLTA